MFRIGNSIAQHVLVQGKVEVVWKESVIEHYSQSQTMFGKLDDVEDRSLTNTHGKLHTLITRMHHT